VKQSLISIFLILMCSLCWALGTTSPNTNSVASKDTMTVDSSLNNVVILPQITYRAEPAYPQKALDSGITAIVQITAFVDSTGYVARVITDSCTTPGYGFEDAATVAAYQSRYQPAWRMGRPIGMWVTYKMRFTLKR
jgi:hypothetical protein